MNGCYLLTFFFRRRNEMIPAMAAAQAVMTNVKSMGLLLVRALSAAGFSDSV